MSAAEKILRRLLQRGERARLRGDSGASSLPMTAASCPEYAALASLEEFESFRAALALAEREGAIVVTPRRDGASGGVERITVQDLERLAAHLGVRLLGERSEEALQVLDSWLPRYPVVGKLLQAWASGKKVRGRGPEAAADVAAALLAVDSRLRDERDECILRRESVRLYGDSKRLERLTPWLELLVTGELAASGLRNEDIWSALGLRREPQPMLIAGCGTVKLEVGQLELVKPYLGLPVEAVRWIESTADYVLTIENLTSFHDAARALPDARGLLIYTGGMPSPAWRALYARVLRGLPAPLAVYHWGDIDEGGFRIAATLARTAAAVDRCLQPWQMSPTAAQAAGVPCAGEASAAVLAAMQRWARAAGWASLAAELACCPQRFEQEAMNPRFPDSLPAEMI